MSMAKKKTLPTRSKDVPATVGMLHMVRDELRSDIRALEFKMDSRFSRMDSEFDKMNSKFHKIDSELHKMNSEMEKMSSSMHQMQLLAEEQRAENRIVLDGLTSLFHAKKELRIALSR